MRLCYPNGLKYTLGKKQPNRQLWYHSVYCSDWTGSRTVMPPANVRVHPSGHASHSQTHNHHDSPHLLNSFPCEAARCTAISNNSPSSFWYLPALQVRKYEKFIRKFKSDTRGVARLGLTHPHRVLPFTSLNRCQTIRPVELRLQTQTFSHNARKISKPFGWLKNNYSFCILKLTCGYYWPGDSWGPACHWRSFLSEELGLFP